MTFLPGGAFTMGSDQGETDERPPHEVTLDAFAMDRTEVTHAMFTKMELPQPFPVAGRSGRAGEPGSLA